MPHSVLPWLSLRQALRIVHHVPGRIRLRLVRPAGAASAAGALDHFLARARDAGSVRSVRLSPGTLSAVIEYDPRKVTPEQWVSLLSGPESLAMAALSALLPADVPRQDNSRQPEATADGTATDGLCQAIPA